jgi:hypothetical protein
MKRTIMAAALSLAAVAPAWAGPPHITIQTHPAGGAFLIAYTFHHGTAIAIPLAGTAEGLVGGRRITVALRFEQVPDTNAYTVANTWGGTGVWVLNIGMQGNYHGGAGAVVGVDRRGEPTFVQYPRTVTGITRMATRGEVDAMLRALEAGQQPPALSDANWTVVLRLLALALVLGAAVTALGRPMTARRAQPHAIAA